MRKLIVSVLLCLAFQLSFSQDSLLLHYSKTITKAELSEHVYTLSSEKFDGRNTGSEGQRMAAEYIQDEFREDGLKEPGLGSSMPYFQEFALEKCYWKELQLSVEGIEFSAGEDFIFLSEPENVAGNYPVIFAGYGIDDSLYSDYQNLDVKGKVVVAFSGEPKGKDGNYIISGKSEPSRKAYYFSKAETAAEKGAAGLIVMATDDKNFKKYAKHYDEMFSQPNISYLETEKKKSIFTVYTNLASGAKILSTNPHALELILKEKDTDPLANSGNFTSSVRINSVIECYPMNTENVIGIVEGTDKKEEAVVVIAHYDHKGRVDGKLYPGADDNATGTASVMELAEAFAKAARDGHPPRRTMIFMAVAGEELGLYGSQYYSEHPVIPLNKTYACVNIDMIGRVASEYKDETNYIGGYVYQSLELLHIAMLNDSLLAPGFKNYLQYRPQVRGGSDHYYFAKNGIPSIFYFEGIHKDYHGTGDTPDKILYDRMEVMVRAIFGTAWELSNSDEKLKIED